MSELHEYLICKIKVETNEKKNQISERKKKKKRKGSMRKIKKNIRKLLSFNKFISVSVEPFPTHNFSALYSLYG